MSRILGACQTDYLACGVPFKLDSGAELSNFVLAYETYGELNDKGDNAILICHPLTGDQYVASTNPVNGRSGWWDIMVGPGKPIDTEQYYVICSNVLGGCMGSSGPVVKNPITDELWKTDFPLVTITDMVRAQALLLDWLRIDKLHAVIGGSMGGMQALEWLRIFPDRIRGVLALATSYRQSTQGIAFNAVGRRAIINDPNWNGGNYTSETAPKKSLEIARMVAHITYLSADKLEKKFSRQLQSKNDKSYSIDIDYQIESYLCHQGNTFTERFDPNSYLYVTIAVDYFNQAENYGDCLADAYAAALGASRPAVGLISISSDWAYPPSESHEIEKALTSIGVPVRHITVENEEGHDGFLLQDSDISGEVRYFLSQSIK